MRGIDEEARRIGGVEVGVEVDQPQPKGRHRLVRRPEAAFYPGLEQPGRVHGFDIIDGLDVTDARGQAFAVGAEDLAVHPPAVQPHVPALEGARHLEFVQDHQPLLGPHVSRISDCE